MDDSLDIEPYEGIDDEVSLEAIRLHDGVLMWFDENIEADEE